VLSLLGLSPVGLATIFFCLDSRFSFLLPPMTRRATVEVFDPAPTRDMVWFIFYFSCYKYTLCRGHVICSGWGLLLVYVGGGCLLRCVGMFY
jgi:hypothetical protein